MHGSGTANCWASRCRSPGKRPRSPGHAAAGVDPVATKSTLTDVVTAADRAVERQVRGAICAARPGDVVLGEEYGGGENGRRRGGGALDLDPIDGTVNYLYGLPQYAVSHRRRGRRGGRGRGGRQRRDRARSGPRRSGGGALPTGGRLPAPVDDRPGPGAGRHRLRLRRRPRARHQAAVLAGLIREIRDIRRFGAGGDRPVPRGRGQPGRVLREGPQRLGPRRRRSGRAPRPACWSPACPAPPPGPEWWWPPRRPCTSACTTAWSNWTRTKAQ